MYYLYLFGRLWCLLLPRKVCYCIVSLLADFKFWLSKTDRETVRYNISAIMHNPKRIHACTRNVFRNFGFYLVDFLSLAKIDKQFIQTYVTIEGREYLEEAAQRKKGVILISAHIGNYELGASLTSFLGYTVYAVALPHKDERINAVFNEQRNIFDVDVISTGSSIKKCLQALRNEMMVAFLGDRNFTNARGEKVVIWGREVLLPRGPEFFSVKTGAAIVPTFVIRHKKYFYRFIFEQPIYPEQNGSPKTIFDMVEEYSHVLERYIMRYPDQWYMFQKYWPDKQASNSSPPATE